MSGLFPISIDEQIYEVERELTMRERVYPHWIASGKLREDTADEQVNRMKAALETLRKVKGA